MADVFIGLVIAFLAFLTWRLVASFTGGPTRKEAFVLPSGVKLSPQPLLSDTDLLLYNLIRLAVQDHYLVFARVPLWAIINVEGERKARSQVLRHIALKHLDFVLVHPGTKAAEQVVLIEEASQSVENPRRGEIHLVLQRAGITMTTLKPHTSYTVPQLAQLLGVGDEE
ncbi:MAG: DUF2726 domain-containing protein [Nitrospirota bacterium]